MTVCYPSMAGGATILWGGSRLPKNGLFLPPWKCPQMGLSCGSSDSHNMPPSDNEPRRIGSYFKAGLVKQLRLARVWDLEEGGLPPRSLQLVVGDAMSAHSTISKRPCCEGSTSRQKRNCSASNFRRRDQARRAGWNAIRLIVTTRIQARLST